MKPRPEPFDSDDRRQRRPKKRPARRQRPSSRRREKEPSQSVPTTPVPKTSRQLAFALLQEGDLLGERADGRPPKLFATERLETALAKFSLSAEERRLTQELLNGTIRRKGTLDLLLSACCQRPLDELELELVWLMRLGAYQLVYLDAIPDHAALNETVDVARWYGKVRWCKFLNGNLRGVSRLLTQQEVTAPGPDRLLTRNGNYRQLQSELLADPALAPVEYLSQSHAIPLWLLERWSQQFNQDELGAVCDWFNQPAPLYLRVNTLKTNRNEYLQLLGNSEIEALPGETARSVRLVKSAAIKLLPGYEDGQFTVQDQTPQQICDLLDAKPGEKIWDVCAAPGTKTTCIAESMRNEGQLLATDTNERRLPRVRENATRLGIDIIRTEVLPEQPPYAISDTFDAILIDAPCSNTGVLGKRPEARWRLKPSDIGELAQLQRQLLLSAITFLKPGGRLVYSTCSIEPEENADQIARFIEQHPEFQLKRELHFRPGQPADGGYAALLVRAE